MNKNQVKQSFINSVTWQVNLTEFVGCIDNHYPKNKTFRFLKLTTWILLKITHDASVGEAMTIFTDGSCTGKMAYVGPCDKVIYTNFSSAQRAKLQVVITVLEDFNQPVNIVSDSTYVVQATLHIKTALIKYIIEEQLYQLFNSVQTAVHAWEFPFYITHIQAHTNLPGPLIKGYEQADLLVSPSLTDAQNFHSLIHLNAAGLKNKYQITWKQAKDIIQHCPQCQAITTSRN